MRYTAKVESREEVHGVNVQVLFYGISVIVSLYVHDCVYIQNKCAYYVYFLHAQYFNFVSSQSEVDFFSWRCAIQTAAAHIYLLACQEVLCCWNECKK